MQESIILASEGVYGVLKGTKLGAQPKFSTWGRRDKAMEHRRSQPTQFDLCSKRG